MSGAGSQKMSETPTLAWREPPASMDSNEYCARSTKDFGNERDGLPLRTEGVKLYCFCLYIFSRKE
jgi:hypothetical protein